MRFKEWLAEWADFGLDVVPQKNLERMDDEKPVSPLNVEYVCEQISKFKLGIKEATEPFFGEIEWGEGPGSIQLCFSSSRGAYAVIRRHTKNTLGESVWVCKKVVEIRNFYDRHEDSLAQNLIKMLEEVDNGQIESPVADFTGLERLVLYIADKLKTKTSQRIFLPEGIRRIVTNEHYIIQFGVTGMGVQRAGQKRLDQLHIEVNYNKSLGLIKISCNEVGDRLRSHRWIIDPSQFIEYYSPAQPKEEIAGSLLSLLNSY